jgi:glutamate mutase epsilon subunit
MNNMFAMKKKSQGNSFTLEKSTKDIEVDRILDKVIEKKNLTHIEKKFLDNYENITEYDLQSWSHLSKNMTFEKIMEILSKNKKIICNLCDRDGKINEQIVSINNDFEKEECILYLKNKNLVKLSDNFFYNIEYSIKKDTYSLTEQDEYFEKINIVNED